MVALHSGLTSNSTTAPTQAPGKQIRGVCGIQRRRGPRDLSLNDSATTADHASFFSSGSCSARPYDRSWPQLFLESPMWVSMPRAVLTTSCFSSGHADQVRSLGWCRKIIASATNPTPTGGPIIQHGKVAATSSGACSPTPVAGNEPRRVDRYTARSLAHRVGCEHRM